VRTYEPFITLNKNGRGIYILDTTMGCSSGVKDTPGGCYNDCYSARAAKIYGYDFNTTVVRKFKNKQHINEIRNQVKKIPLGFVRIGGSGDPSEAWQHTIDVCKLLQDVQLSLFDIKTEIVIITKHWQTLTESQLQEIKKLPICINTSVSALDNPEMLKKNVEQYSLLKNYCKSVLRVVTCDFNTSNVTGYGYSIIQDILLKNQNVIDTVFRPSKKNPLVTNNIINIHKTKFLGKNAIVSKFNKKTYFGKCDTCIEKCGVGKLN
jgi:hypothetical protein